MKVHEMGRIRHGCHTRVIHSVHGFNTITVEHPEVSIITGFQAQSTGLHNSVPHYIPTERQVEESSHEVKVEAKMH